MYFVYFLHSEKCDRYYIAYCGDFEARLDRDNKGMVKATKNCGPYIIKASKISTEIEARKEGLRLKKMKRKPITNALPARHYFLWTISL